MQHRTWIWLISIPILMLGCSRSNGNNGGDPPAAAAQVPDNFEAPEYSTARGIGPGVTVDGRISRGALTVGLSSFPTWKVELTVANHTGSVVRLGESMTVLEQLRSLDDMVGIYVARESKRPTGHLKRMSTRYGLLWGLSVELDGPGVWPFGALPGGSSLTGLDLLVLVASMKFVKPYYPDGGYPSVPAGKQVVIREEIVVPLKNPSQSTILLAPFVLEEGKVPVQIALRFADVAGAQEGQTLTPIESKSYSAADPTLAQLPSDTTQPLWLRLHALNWLAEARFEETVGTLMRFASDPDTPANMRVAALLNLGLHQHKPAIPLLLSTLDKNEALQRAVAIVALGEMGDSGVAGRIRVLLNDPDETVVREAVVSMGKLKDTDSVGPMLNMFADPKKEKQYDEIASALSQIGTSEAWGGLMKVGSDRNAGTKPRAAVMAALGNARYAPAVPLLGRIVADETDDAGLRMSAVSGLSKSGGPEAWNAIKAACIARDSSVAESALRALAQSRDSANQTYVIEIAGNATHPSREAAIKQITIEKIGGAAPTLRKALLDPATPARLLPVALTALQATGNKAGPDELAAVWSAYRKETDASAGESLADALIESKFGDKAVIPILVSELDEDRNKLWFSHIKLLRHLSGEQIGPEYRYGEKQSHKADFDKWRQWAQQSR